VRSDIAKQPEQVFPDSPSVFSVPVRYILSN
jgi:hypothetical protein